MFKILNNPILDCKHKVCHKCFLGFVKNKNYKCPKRYFILLNFIILGIVLKNL